MERKDSEIMLDETEEVKELTHNPSQSQPFKMVTSESIQRLEMDAGVHQPFESMFTDAVYSNRKKKGDYNYKSNLVSAASLLSNGRNKSTS